MLDVQIDLTFEHEGNEMKKVLLASTALVLSAGVAAADVTVGGSGRMGIIDDFTGDLAFTSRIRISFAASGTTDGGLSFGGSIRADNAVGGNVGTDGSVFVSGAFGTLTMGDVSGAPEAAVGDVSGVGLTGLGDLNEMTYISNSDRPAARYDYSFGDFGVHVSADNPGPAGDQAVGIAVSWSMGDFSAGLGYEHDEDGTAGGVDNHLIGGVSIGFGDATIKGIFGTADLTAGGSAEQWGLSLDYSMGGVTATAFYVDKDTALGSEAWGIGGAYDLGGGASLKGGYVSNETTGNDGFDFGLSMTF